MLHSLGLLSICKNWRNFFMKKTQTMTIIAILSALSFVLMIPNFPIIPGVDFLKLDFSILPILLGLILLDLKSTYVILFLRSLLKLLLDNGGPGSMVGLPMNMVAFGIFILSFALIWKDRDSKVKYVLASIVGTLAMTVTMVFLNYVYAIPLYAKFANFDISKFIGVGKYLMSMVIPFNLLEGVIFAVSFAVVYAATQPILKNYISNEN
ncbi:ECF transporter S component [Streptococcus mutans]|uniref:ECF transporter S component n=1 Tax=Streptococcus mutans TaxID=1309 RepID=UPI0036F3711B